MEDYRHGAFYLAPSQAAAEKVDALRRLYDPLSSEISGAHISISEPLPRPLTSAQIQELGQALATFEPFRLIYGPLRSFPPHPGVVFEIHPQAKITELRTTIHSTSIFANVPQTHAMIPAHMTVAEFISLERTDELLTELAPKVMGGSFLCDSLRYWVPNKDFSFEELLTIPLGVTI